jgi:hypothetical protein
MNGCPWPVISKARRDDMNAFRFDWMKTRLFMILISAGFLAYSVCVLVPAALTDATQWPWVEGTIIDRSARKARRSGSIHNLIVTYEYKVNDVRYTSRRVTLTGSVAQRVNAGHWREALNKAGFPLGGQVRVYYNPEKPRQAVLIPSLGRGRRALYLGVTAFSGFTLVAAIFGRVRERM